MIGEEVGAGVYDKCYHGIQGMDDTNISDFKLCGLRWMEYPLLAHGPANNATAMPTRLSVSCAQRSEKKPGTIEMIG